MENPPPSGDSRHQIRAGFGAQVAYTGRIWRRVVDQHMRPFGLTEATWLPLLHLARAVAPMRQKDLAASLSLDGSSVVRLLDALETGGMVERREDGGDRRAKAIVMTELGRETVAKVQSVARQVREEALAGVTDDELATASDVLDRVSRALAQRERDFDE
ncbi:MAG: MarR family transcriptional regulator [Hyphomicrobiales bacterium]|nr:MarR family transcriptional regulator [Hyphomicrobiales bacterium]